MLVIRAHYFHTNIFIEELQNYTLLHAATNYNQLDIVRFLIEEMNAEVNAKDSNSNSPLHVACSNGNDKIIEYLLEKGADPDAKDNKTLTPDKCLSRARIHPNIDEKIRRMFNKRKFQIQKDILTKRRRLNVANE